MSNKTMTFYEDSTTNPFSEALAKAAEDGSEIQVLIQPEGEPAVTKTATVRKHENAETGQAEFEVTVR